MEPHQQTMGHGARKTDYKSMGKVDKLSLQPRAEGGILIGGRHHRGGHSLSTLPYPRQMTPFPAGHVINSLKKGL